jgi:hypothetical protein
MDARNAASDRTLRTADHLPGVDLSTGQLAGPKVSLDAVEMWDLRRNPAPLLRFADLS